MDTSQKLDKKYHFDLYNRQPLTLVKGKGSRVWDSDGKEYIDALAGIAVNNVGHCHPKVVAAIQEQAAELIHVSNFYTTEPQSQLAQRLVELSELDRVFFCNSGTEAVEGALKLARKYGHNHNKEGNIISMEGCFHGRTLGSIATGKRKYQQGFDPMPSGFLQVPFNDFDAIEKAADDQTLAVLIEPVQGEGGIQPVNAEYIKKVRKFCTDNNILLIFDEIQCGAGRTGRYFAYENFDVVPDILTMAKGLGGGVPIGAVLAREDVASAFEHGNHGTTFGGNPLACHAALATINAIHDEDMLTSARENGSWLMERLQETAQTEDAITEVRGIGLMIGVEMSYPCADIVDYMRENGILSNCASGNVVRIVPPLNIPRKDLQTFLKVLIKAIEKTKVNH